MATFKIGQRVRIARNFVTDDGETIIMGVRGTEGTILSELKLCLLGTRKVQMHFLCLDGVGSTCPAGLPLAAHPSQLEPLQPEGWKVVAWSDCLWSPSEELLNA